MLIEGSSDGLSRYRLNIQIPIGNTKGDAILSAVMSDRAESMDEEMPEEGPVGDEVVSTTP